MGTNFEEADGFLGERSRRFYEERARGGVGLIILGVGAVSYPNGVCLPRQVAISDDKYLPGLKKLTSQIHEHGAKIAIQIQHAGKVATRDMSDGRAMMMPSEYSYVMGDLTNDITGEELAGMSAGMVQAGAKIEYHTMTDDDIKTVIEYFADAGDRAKRAGFDGVEIHSGHGYLISSFISPKTNKRTDAYGGSVENRSRLLTDVIKAIRNRVGNDFPVWCRLDGKEFMIDGGISAEDAQQTAMLAEAAGADAIHVSAYADASSGVAFTVAPLVQQPCGFVDLAGGIKKKVGIPVIAVGRIEPEEGNKIIKTGKADFIAMARKLITDPELPSKLTQGHPEDIRPCICCYTCVGEIFQRRSVECAVNKTAGKESEIHITKAEIKKRVLVIGGGPAGMEAARVAAFRGHDVTLCEKSDRLGGTLFFASMLYNDNTGLMEWLKTQVDKLKVDVQLNREVTPELVKEIKPDEVVVAVGARRELPDIPGVNQPHVLGGDDLRGLMIGSDKKVAKEKLSLMQRTMLGLGKKTGISDNIDLAREMTKLWMPIGNRVAVIGGGLVGVELAMFLAERKRTVTLIEETNKLATEMALPRRWRALHEIREIGVNILCETTVESIGAKDITCVLKDGEKQLLKIDSVIIASGIQANHTLAEKIRKMGFDVHLIGDCSRVEYIKGAMENGFEVGRAL